MELNLVVSVTILRRETRELKFNWETNAVSEKEIGFSRYPELTKVIQGREGN